MRAVFAHALRAVVDQLASGLAGLPKTRRKKAMATMAGLVGAVVLARAVDDDALRDEILRSTREALLAV